MLQSSFSQLKIESNPSELKSELWYILLHGSTQNLQAFIYEVEIDRTLFANKHDIFTSSFNGVTPLEFVADNPLKKGMIEKILHIESSPKRRRLY